LGDLAQFRPRAAFTNRWVRGDGLLSARRAVRYGRPLESGSYRLAQVAGNPRLWVQVRVPAEMEGPRFVPPTTFVGRLVPFGSGGIRYDGLESAITDTGQDEPGAEAWVLIDGEAPSTTHWSLALMALFIGFALFNVYGLVHLLRPVRDA
jgi:hypothetical protein